MFPKRLLYHWIFSSTCFVLILYVLGGDSCCVGKIISPCTTHHNMPPRHGKSHKHASIACRQFWENYGRFWINNHFFGSFYQSMVTILHFLSTINTFLFKNIQCYGRNCNVGYFYVILWLGNTWIHGHFTILILKTCLDASSLSCNMPWYVRVKQVRVRTCYVWDRGEYLLTFPNKPSRKSLPFLQDLLKK